MFLLSNIMVGINILYEKKYTGTAWNENIYFSKVICNTKLNKVLLKQTDDMFLAFKLYKTKMYSVKVVLRLILLHYLTGNNERMIWWINTSGISHLFFFNKEKNLNESFQFFYSSYVIFSSSFYEIVISIFQFNRVSKYGTKVYI